MSADGSASVRNLLARLSDRLRIAATEVVWTQWAAVGATATGRGSARSIVDPEALVLLSLSPALEERRLHDLVADWAALHSSLLSVQRIKNLATEGTKGAHERLATFAQVTLQAGKDFRWRALAADQEYTKRSVSRRTSKIRAVEAPHFGEAAIWLKLRLGLSVGIKADTLAFLLGRGDWVSARAVSEATSYTAAAVGRALDDLVAARFVLMLEAPHEPAHYRAPTEAWSKLLEIEGHMPVWRDWQKRFALVDAFLTWADNARERTVSRYAFGVKGRELMREHRAVFAQDQLAVLDEHPAVPDWAKYVEQSLRDLARRMETEV